MKSQQLKKQLREIEKQTAKTPSNAEIVKLVKSKKEEINRYARKGVCQRF